MSYRRYLETKIERPIATTLEGVLEDLRTLPERLDEHLATIRKDDSLSAEERAYHEREKRAEAQRHRDRLLPVARELASDAQRALREHRARRRVDPVALDRVRSLLREQNATVDAVLDHARALGDPELVAALGAEIADRALARRPGQSRPDPQQARAAEEAQLACDRTLLEMTDDSRLQKALDLHETAQTVEPTLRFALAGTEGNTLGAVAHARLVAPHSRGDSGDPYQQEPKYQQASRPVSGVGAVVPQTQPERSPGGITTSRQR